MADQENTFPGGESDDDSYGRHAPSELDEPTVMDEARAAATGVPITESA